MELKDDKMAEPETPKAEMNHIKEPLEPAVKEPAEEPKSPQEPKEVEKNAVETPNVVLNPEAHPAHVNMVKSEEDMLVKEQPPQEREKEVDTAENVVVIQDNDEVVKKEPVSETPAVGVETSVTEDALRQVKVTVSVPEDKPTPPSSPVKEEEKRETEDEKSAMRKVNETPPKRRFEKKNSDSGIGSVADNSSIDLNLSISSFISKSKEPGSIQVRVSTELEVGVGGTVRLSMRLTGGCISKLFERH